MKKILFNKVVVGLSLIAGLMMSSMLPAQQLHFYSSWYDYPLLYNPSFAGTDYHVNIGLLHRTQFSGFSGAPVMNMILADGKLKAGKMYAGGFVSNQKKGIFNNTQAQVMYAYRINFNEGTFLKFGVAAGILDQNVNFGAVVVKNYDDPNLFQGNQHKTGFDANAGLSFYMKDLQVGFSVPSLAGAKLKYKESSNTRVYYAMSRHYTASLRYDIALNRDKEMYLTPFFLTRFVQNAPVQFDGGLMFDWRDKFRVGGFYRSSYAVTASASFTVTRRFTLSYNYDFAIGKIGTYSGLTHEITFNCKLGKLKERSAKDTVKTGAVVEGKNNASENKKYEPGKTDYKRTKESQSGIQVITDHHTNYVFANGNPVPKGYYVVVGSYYYQDYAEKEVKRYASFGYPEADDFINKRDKFNYVYIHKADTKEEAMNMAAEAKVSGITDVWIEVLTD